MQIEKLFSEFDKLQNIYGDKNLSAIYGAGEIDNPKICFVFMNPTSKNIASQKSYKGLKAPWIGTKNIWKMFFNLGIIPEDLFLEINDKKSLDWNEEFAIKIYEYLKSKSIYITNLAKCTQIDARHLQNSIFENYLPSFYEEIEILNPEKIITFGGQVSSIILGKNIKISEYRKRFEILKIKEKSFKVFPVFYPVGQGMRNMKLAKEDLEFLILDF